MKTNSRFHRVITFTFAAVCAAGISSARAAQAEQRPVTCVQKGLVALYDGIYNSTNAAGVPVHDELARQWVDWTGHTSSFELGGTATNLETAVLFDGEGWATNMNETMKAVIASANGTFEFPYRMDELVYDGIFCHFAYADGTHRGFTARSGYPSGGNAWGTFACVEYQQNTWKVMNLTPSAGVRHTATFTLDSKNCTIYSDGVQLGTSAKGSVAPTTAFMGIGRGSPTDARTTGLVKYTCHGIRVYNRVLSADEIAWNRAYDRMRFDGVSAAEAFTGLTPPDGLAAPDENGVFRARVSIASFTDEPVLSFDGGNTWFAATNGWFELGSKLLVTVREDLRLAAKLTGTGVVKQPDDSYVVTVSGPVRVHLLADLTVLYVSDGLLAFWDVQNNSGTGEMDFASKYWYDTLDATRYWTLGGSCNFSAATSALEIPSGSTCSFSGTMPTFVTCDTCMRWDKGRKFFNNTATTGFIFTQTGGFGRESQHMSVPFSAVSGEPDTFTYNSGNKTYYRRGFDLGRSHGFELQQYQGNAGNTLGGRFNTEAYFQGSVYALRLYSRDLTADETKRNAVLDGLRYLGRALPDGWRMHGARLQARLSFDLGPGVTVSAGGAQIATGEPVWLNAGTEVTATATPGEGEYAIWNGAPLEAAFADEGNTITFTLHAPRTLECELLRPDEVWQNGKTLDSKGYSNDTAVVYLPAGTVTGPSVWAKRLVLGGGTNTAALTLTKGVTLSDRLDVNRSATLTINTASAATNGVTVRAGGTITHAANGGTKTNRYRVDLQTDGMMTVEEGGKVFADGCGFRSNDSSTWSDGQESITTPNTSGWGQNGEGANGGGVIRLQANELRANGRITANGNHGTSYYGGHAGSVWITVGAISGAGVISCDGGRFYHSGHGGNGGRISVRLTQPGADFTAFTGRLSAYGGYNYQYSIAADESATNGKNNGPAGTIFMEIGDGHRTLLLKDGNIGAESRRKTSYSGSKFPADEKLTVDDIEIVGSPFLSLVNGTDLTVCGDVRMSSGGLYTALGGVVSAAGARVTFADAEKVSHLIGSQNYGTFVCTEPGKKIVFETGKTYTVTTSGAFTLAGSDAEPVWLLPSTADGTWVLALQSDVARDVKYAAVSNSHALAGLAVTVQGGRDLGGNDSGWAFVDFIEPGAPMRWTGAESSDWKSKGNWVPAREPIATDDITIYSETEGGTAVTNFPVIDAGIGTPQLSKLTIKDGAKLTIDGGGLLVTNLLSVQSGGLLDVKGSEVVTVSGDLAFANAACFGCGKGRVILTGDLVQQFDAGTAVFNRIYVRKTGGGVTWNDGLTADYFECTTTDDLAFTFQNGKTFTLTQMYLCGLADEVAKLSLASSSPDDCWFLRATTAQRVAGVTVADSDATGGAPVYTGAPSSGNGNTPGWNFGGTCAEWTGKKGDGKFASDGNWSDGVVPGPTSRVAIPCAEGGSIEITMPTTDVALSNLVVGVGGGTVNLTVNGMLNVTEDLELREKVTMTFNTKKVCTVGRDVMLRSGAKVTHTSNTGSADSYAVNMAVGRNFTVEDTAAVTADGLGRTATFAIHGGSSGYNNAVDGEQGACYDSVFEPILSGGNGDKKGGGIIHLTVGGTLSVCGSVTANGYSDSRKVASDGFGSGAGGSVWITCARLVGSGLIAADGGCGWHTGSLGGGGRVAVQLTDSAADFDAFGGTVQALYGRNDQYGGEYPSGGCGTVSLRTADGVGEIRIGDIENNLNKKLQNTSWTDLPMAADGSARKAYKQQTVVLGKRGRLRLTDDVTIQDLVLEKCVNGLADFKRNILLNGHTLTIVSRAHKDGKGWYSGWENYVIKGSNSVTGAKGKIVWKGGMCLIVR